MVGKRLVEKRLTEGDLDEISWKEISGYNVYSVCLNDIHLKWSIPYRGTIIPMI